MADVYKLEWTHSRKTIQSGIGEILNQDPFLDTVVVCCDGVLNQNKLTMGLVFPNLNSVSMFDIPLEQTILMPDHSVMEIQALISDLFPAGEVINATYETKGDEIEVHMEDNNFEHYLENDPVPKTYGMRRGRGRPCMNNSMPTRFQCDFCSKGFYYKSMLTQHEKLHSGGSRETCEICGAEYSTRQNLKNHMIKYHGPDSYVPRKRGRPPIDHEKRLSGSSLTRPYRARGRGRGTHSMSGVNARSAVADLQIEGYSTDNSMNYSNDTLEYQDCNENIETDPIITENYLHQGINDGDSDIAEEDPVIVDPSEKIEPGTSNEYIEVKDDYKETDLSILQAVTVGTSENVDLESETEDIVASAIETSASGESSNIDNTSPAPVTSTYLPPDPAETEYQVG